LLSTSQATRCFRLFLRLSWRDAFGFLRLSSHLLLSCPPSRSISSKHPSCCPLTLHTTPTASSRLSLALILSN
jgi:hypothetical protein